MGRLRKFLNKWHMSRNLSERRDPVMPACGGRTFQEERTASAKVLRQEHTGYVQGTARRQMEWVLEKSQEMNLINLDILTHRFGKGTAFYSESHVKPLEDFEQGTHDLISIWEKYFLRSMRRIDSERWRMEAIVISWLWERRCKHIDEMMVDMTSVTALEMKAGHVCGTYLEIKPTVLPNG